MKISAILLAGGMGSRMESSVPKQYLPLAGKPLALHSYEVLATSRYIDEVIVVCNHSYAHLFPCSKAAKPGKRRQDSLLNGIQKVSSDADFIVVHDAARPLLNFDDLGRVIHAGVRYGAATLATPVKMTIKQANAQQMVSQTLDRDTLYEIQTPQVIKKEILLKGMALAHAKNITVTDDVSFAEIVGAPVKLVIGSYENIKITTFEDLSFAEYTLRERTPLHI